MKLNENNYVNKTILIDADSLCFTSENDTYEVAQEKLEWKINRIKNRIDYKNQNILFFLTFGKSFRNELYTEYKAQRTVKPENVKLLKQYIIDTYSKKENTDVIFEKGFEADDLICDVYRTDPDNYILCSIDKDIIKNMVGKHINLYSYDFILTNEEDAYTHFYTQIIKGDKIDNIPDIAKGIGPAYLKNIKMMSELNYEQIAKYICYKKNIDYKTRYRLLYCGNSENIILEENKIFENNEIDYWLGLCDGFEKKKIKTKQKNIIGEKKYKNRLKEKYNPKVMMAPGKHKDKTWYEVSLCDPKYIKWMISVTEDLELKNMLVDLINKK